MVVWPMQRPYGLLPSLLCRASIRPLIEELYIFKNSGMLDLTTGTFGKNRERERENCELMMSL